MYFELESAPVLGDDGPDLPVRNRLMREVGLKVALDELPFLLEANSWTILPSSGASSPPQSLSRSFL